MKILIVNTSDIDGGAARAGYRIHNSLLKQGIDSQMLVLCKSSDDYTVLAETNKIKKRLNKLLPFLESIPSRLYTKRSDALYSSSWIGLSNLIREINRINPDIVHLNWVCGGFLKIEDMRKINAPIVWSIQDMWAFTGGCHYDNDCGRYEENCGKCKVLNSKKDNDLSRRVFKRKQKTFPKISNLTVVAISKWLESCAKNSHLLHDKKVVTIPNPIDAQIFRPVTIEYSRELFNLPPNKKLILFGAIGATTDPRKGFKELAEAMTKLTESDDIELVVFGSSTPQNKPDLKFKTHYLGHLSDDVSLVTLYSAVDVMIVPSLQEAFGQTATESMSCGTPVVCFDATGPKDIVDHKVNGYLAKPFDPKDLARGIEWVLNNSDYDDLCQKAREKVVREFDSKVVAKKYIELYNEIIK